MLNIMVSVDQEIHLPILQHPLLLQLDVLTSIGPFSVVLPREKIDAEKVL
jgi:hypothetical protein